MSDGRFEKGDEAADRAYRAGQETGEVKEIPVIAGTVRWERPTRRSFWNALADPEREALAAAGVEQIFRAGSVLCRAGDESSQVMIIDSGWVKVSVKVSAGAEAREDILAIRGQGDVVGERAALTTQVRSATVTALDEVSAMVVPAERFAEFLRGHPRAAEVLQRQIIERREEDRARLSLGEPAGAERRLAWLLLDLAQRRGSYQQVSPAMFTLPVSQQELADWAGTSPDTVGRFLRSWRERGIIARSDRARRLTVVDLDGLAAMCNPAPAAQPRTAVSRAGAGQLLEEDTGELYPEPGEARTRHADLEERAVLGSFGTLAGEGRPVTSAGAEASHAQSGTQRPGPTRNVPPWLEVSGEPLNCSVLFTDVAGFGDPKRNDGDREAVRKALYEISQSALEASGVVWAACYYEDRGDGTVIVVPPTIATVRVVDPLIPELASRLRAVQPAGGRRGADTAEGGVACRASRPGCGRADGRGRYRRRPHSRRACAQGKACRGSGRPDVRRVRLRL